MNGTKFLAFTLALAGLFALAGCGASVGGGGSSSAQGKTLTNDYALSVPTYPVMAAYPTEDAYFDEKTGSFDDKGYDKAYNAWLKSTEQLEKASPEMVQVVGQFSASSLPVLLSGKAGENQLCSPVNLYMALAMLAEVTEGNSRTQVLDKLGVSDTEALRKQVHTLWQDVYCSDGIAERVLGNSLWLSNWMTYRNDTLKTLSEDYYASVFQGTMGDADYTRAFQAWLSEQTRGQLSQQASGLTLSPETVLALASTLYCKAAWAEPFATAETRDQVFHAPDGDVTCPFMHETETAVYSKGSRFSAVRKQLSNTGDMVFLLPEKGCTPEELLRDDEAIQFLNSGKAKEQSTLQVNLSLPKFDVSSDMELTQAFQQLGIRDVFDPAKADFSSLAPEAERDCYVSQVRHAVRVTADEEGVEAAAYTAMALAEAAMPPEEQVDFVLDRPFLFVLQSDSGLPLFVGVVNRPA